MDSDKIHQHQEEKFLSVKKTTLVHFKIHVDLCVNPIDSQEDKRGYT